MPELPEMETYRRLLQPRLVNRPIIGVEVNREKSVNIPVEQFRSALLSRSITHVDRVAKQLIFRLNDGHQLIVHLMLGGWMFYGREADRPDRTIQVRISFGPESLYFINLRLGHLHWINDHELQHIIDRYGLDPYAPELNATVLHKLLTTRRTALKIALIDQGLVAGIGNCYSDEICYTAGLLPTRSCSSLTLEESERLLVAMRHVLSDATNYGGYMDHPLYVGDTLTGGYDERCQVYDREGEPCLRCREPIIHETVRNRKTYYCISCQR